jgi:AcrR family transcriptional regulator
MSPRVGLDRAAVVEAAAALADEVGFEGVTLARLAGRLGVRTPSLYNHVDGLDGLRRELALLGTRELGSRIGRAAVGKTADEAVVAIARAYRAFVKERPGLYAATVRSYRLSDPTDPGQRALEWEVIGVVLDVFASYGLRGDDALHAVRGLRSVVHGFATLESAGGFGIPLEVDESFERLLRIFVDGVRRKPAPKK